MQSPARTIIFGVFCFSLLGMCQGCLLFLPTREGIIYRGDVNNVHGFNELGRGGNLYRTGDAAYVFNPWIETLESTPYQLRLRIADDQQSWFANAGVSVIIECPAPGHDRKTFTTSDGSLRAWLVRDFEYVGSAMKPTLSDSATKPWTAPNYAPLFVTATASQESLPEGVYALSGSISFQTDDADPRPVTFLEMRLITTRPVSVDEKWLAANEATASAVMKERGPHPKADSDDEAWKQLRSKQHHLVTAPAEIGGTFQIEQCLDYSRMP